MHSLFFNYSKDEFTALISSVILGTIVYLLFTAQSGERKVNVLVIVTTFFINIFVTHIASEVLKLFDFGAWRNIVLPLSALLGQHLVYWVMVNRNRLFDFGFKKITGHDMDTEENIKNKNNGKDLN